MVWHLDCRDRSVGGAVLPARLVYPPGSDRNATLDLLAVQRHVVILVHGFNVNRESGQQQLSAFANALAADRLVTTSWLCYTWPGDAAIGPAIYPFVGNDADDAGLELARFIEWAIPAGTTLSFVSHSLGARVVLEALQALPRETYPIDQVCTMAAAVDDFGVSDPEAYRSAVERVGRFSVLASERDNTLRWGYPVGDLLQSFFFRNDVAGAALGFHGPRPRHDKQVPANVEHVQIPTSVGADHSDYLFTGIPSDLERRALAFASQALKSERPLRY